MKFKTRFLNVFLFSLLFTSCFNNLKAPKETKVSFKMDRETVSKIMQASSNSLSSRAAEGQEDVPDFYIDVTLCGDTEETKTSLLTGEVSIDFENVLVNTRVYAKAQIYNYADKEKTTKIVIYRGQSDPIIVHDRVNLLSVKLAAATLTVTFETNGGSPVKAQKVITGQTLEEPEKPVKPEGKEAYSRYDNFAFIGWYTDQALTKPYDFNLPVTDDLTLYAKWLPNFVFVEGSTVENYLVTGRNLRISDLFVSDHEVTQKEYQAVMSSNPSEFSGAENLPVENVTWFQALAYCNLLSIKENLDPCYKINDSINPADWGSPTADTPVSCSLSSNGYRLPTEAEWEYIATKAQRTNTDFGKLAYTSSNSSGKTHQVKFSLADELNLCDIFGNVAEWCFDVHAESLAKTTGPTGPNTVSGGVNNRVVRGGSYNTDASECKPSQRDSADPLEKSKEIGFRLVRSDVNEFKIIKNSVTFESNGGSSVDLQSVVDGECALQPATPTRTGYEFKGWIYDGATFDFSTPITMDIVLEAKWQPITYTISYDLDGGTETTANPTSYTIETETIVLNNPEKTDYNFKGWFDGSNKITKIEKGSYGNLSLIARWTQCHIVTFDLQDGSTPTEQEVENNSTATEPAEPSRTGFTFVRWYDATGSDDDDFDFTRPITGNVSLKALWQYKVTYDSSSGTAVNAQTYKQTEAVTAPTEPTRTGFTFDCWCEDSADGPEYTFGSASSTGNITLYARWKYTITFEANNGEAATTLTTIHTQAVTKPADPSWSTMTFVCWCSDSALQNEYTFGSPSENGNITLYAKWKYLITFDTQGADHIDQQWVIYPNAPVEPNPAPSKDNFEFEYWCTNLSDPENTKYLFDTPYISNDRTLHAKFKTINENLGGITVTFGIATGDIAVTPNDSSTAVTYTVDTSGGEYDSYYWEFDGTAQTSTTAVLTLNKSSLQNGVYDVYLEAEKDGVTYSWTQQITILN